MLEGDLENILCKYPELIEEGLTFLDRQVSLYGKRLDLLFQDKHGEKLLIELKTGTITRKDIGQIMEYEGSILSMRNPTARIMLIGNRVPPNLKRALDHHGIEYKEILIEYLQHFLIQKKDTNLLEPITKDKDGLSESRKVETYKTGNIIGIEGKSRPALLALVEDRWIIQASEILKSKEKVFFYTSSNIGLAEELNTKKVYFKPKGKVHITAYADLIEITHENPKQYRLPGNENITGKYYYGFKNIIDMDVPIPLTDLTYFKSGKNLRNDVPGACVICDPLIEKN